MMDDPIDEGCFKPDVPTCLFALDPFVTDQFRFFGAKCLVKPRSHDWLAVMESSLNLKIVAAVYQSFGLKQPYQEVVPGFNGLWVRNFVLLGAWPALTDAACGFDLRADGFVHEKPDLQHALEGANICPGRPLRMVQAEHMPFVKISNSER
jgi:hypothetical protein